MFEQRVNSDVLTVSTVNSQDQVTQKPLRDSVKQALKNYFAQLNGQDVNDLYELVLAEVEQPLLDMVMQYTRGNQTRAALMMGINRGTLRKKLKKYGHSSWLRLYAIKLIQGNYIITGGAIKLTATMQEREHTRQELVKIDRVRRYLLEEGIIDDEGFIEYISEL